MGRGPIITLFGIGFCSAGTVLFALLNDQDWAIGLGCVLWVAGFICFCLGNTCSGCFGTVVNVHNHGDASQMPLILPVGGAIPIVLPLRTSTTATWVYSDC